MKTLERIIMIASLAILTICSAAIAIVGIFVHHSIGTAAAFGLTTIIAAGLTIGAWREKDTNL